MSDLESEYGRLLAERDRLIASGVDPADLEVVERPPARAAAPSVEPRYAQPFGRDADADGMPDHVASPEPTPGLRAELTAIAAAAHEHYDRTLGPAPRPWIDAALAASPAPEPTPGLREAAEDVLYLCDCPPDWSMTDGSHARECLQSEPALRHLRAALHPETTETGS